MFRQILTGTVPSEEFKISKEELQRQRTEGARERELERELDFLRDAPQRNMTSVQISDIAGLLS